MSQQYTDTSVPGKAIATTRLALLGGEPAHRFGPPRYPVFTDVARERVDALLRSGDSVGLSKQHPLIDEAESTLAEWHGVKQCLGTSTGHAALHSAVVGLELGEGDEVITTPYTWGVPCAAILHNNAIPVFADIDPVTGNLDPAAVQARISDRTRAILVVHMYGQPADLTRLREIADRHKIALIEDGSTAHGARHQGKLVGTVGDASGFSCMGTKLLATTESGFMLTPHDSVYYNAVISSQHAGNNDKPGRSSEPGFPAQLRPYADSLLYTYRLSTINAVLLVEQLKKLDDENAMRAKNRNRLVELLAGVTSVSTPQTPAGDYTTYWMLPFNFQSEVAGISKSTYLKALQAEGVPVIEYMPTPLHELDRLSPQTRAPRVMWTETLRRALASGSKIDDDLPGCEEKVRRGFEMMWHYITPAEEAMQSMANAFCKVEEQLPALRDFERSEQLAEAS
ncbi:MAG: DegT/DnrJ/EryC1/StrS family aminotransferase [Solirubrobacteraceae bacterium]